MVSLKNTHVSGKKRKRNAPTKNFHKAEAVVEDELSILERRICESPQHLNDILKVMDMAYPHGKRTDSDSRAISALCRIFYRCMMNGWFREVAEEKESEKLVRTWFQSRLDRYVELLLAELNDDKSRDPAGHVKLVMKLVKAEVLARGYGLFSTGIFKSLVESLLRHSPETGRAFHEFLSNYASVYEDVRIQAVAVTTGTSTGDDSAIDLNSLKSVFRLLIALHPPTLESDMPQQYWVDDSMFPEGVAPPQVRTPRYRRKNSEDAWLGFLKRPLPREQRREVLIVLTESILPWIYHPERLMDFLTDSFDEGGDMPLLALSGIYHLMQEKNLDYPSFYRKLYSLLDDELLHSKHRSHFFRLFDVFMTSTHLPANLVASFIKRLSRLALFAPPAGVVVVLPWIYNMFQRHPSCTFMMHREIPNVGTAQEKTQLAINDPFDMDELDPMETLAIDSCVWELIALQSHFHPNVATLAKIVSEQFTKQQYNMEDFLDYSYKTLIDSELHKRLKKPPIIEYHIPPAIFKSADGEDEEFGQLFTRVLSAET